MKYISANHTGSFWHGWSVGKPKEHGAWVILLVPLAIGTVWGGTLSYRVLLGWLISVAGFLLWPVARSILRRRRSKTIPWMPLLVLGGASGIAALFLVVERPLTAVWFSFSALLLITELVLIESKARSLLLQQTLAVVGLTQGALVIPYLASGTVQLELVGMWALCAGFFGAGFNHVRQRAEWATCRTEIRNRSRLSFLLLHTTLLGAGMIAALLCGVDAIFGLLLLPSLVRGVATFWSPPQTLVFKAEGMRELMSSLVLFAGVAAIVAL